MEFLKERCFTSLNADELKAGDKVIVTNSLYYLKKQVEEDDVTDEIMYIATDTNDKRFRVDRSGEFALAYLVERAENCTNCGGRFTCIRQKPEHPELTKCCNYKHYECSEYKPKTEQKDEMPELISLGNGQYAERKHYRPFRDTDELIKVWSSRNDGGKAYTLNSLDMPLIWVRNKEDKKVWLITEFDKRILDYLFTNCEFLDGSPCGVEE